MMKIALLLIVSLSLLPGCADINDTNKLIAEANVDRLSKYADGMVACGDNAACQVGVSAAYFSGAGQQNFFRPDTAVDYLRAGLPYAELGTRWYQLFLGSAGTSGDRSSIYVKGDGNSFNLGNDLSAAYGSSLTVDWSNQSVKTNSLYNRSYTLGADRGTVADDGVSTANAE
jgi:hypothetical protein